ncbi:MAG TPA: lysylphosphatidylglycerol synthase transmembrane domain-containing protein [Blastocatellia bacterium]
MDELIKSPGSAAPRAPTASWPLRIGPWLIGALILSGVILVIVSRGEIEDFAQLLHRAAPVWLLVGALFQAATYFSAAAVWYLTLRKAGARYSMRTLVPLGVAKLFSEQALPSGGISGTAFFIAALTRRGIPSEISLAALLVSLISYYAAYLLAAALSLTLLRFYHAVSAWIVAVTILFCLVAVAIPVGTLWLHSRSQRPLPAWLTRIPGVNRLLDLLGDAPGYLLRDGTLIFKTTLFQASIFLLDGATLWAMLQAVGQNVSFLAAFPSFIIASMVATFGLVPLGLGTFEAACVALLRKLGVPLEAALTATLLLRGFTLWLPMLPGMLLARRELKNGHSTTSTNHST